MYRKQNMIDVVVLVLVLQTSMVSANFNFSSVFGSSMVLQRDVRAAVYGQGTPGAAVVIAGGGGLDKLHVATTIRPDGSWKAVFPHAYATGTAGFITATSGSSVISLHDLVFGDM
jgi:hypothetical protein